MHLLHDIGKVGIDEKILNKPGRLTNEEFEEMKKHTLIGASMLKSLGVYQDEELVKVAYQICRWHHERYDGKGYPDGLKGEEIPIAAQVVSVADVYDALTSERVYKKAFSHEKAMEMILAGELRNLQSAAAGVLAGYSGPYPGGNEAGRRAAYACTEFLCGEDDRDGAVGKAYYNVIY